MGAMVPRKKPDPTVYSPTITFEAFADVQAEIGAGFISIGGLLDTLDEAARDELSRDLAHAVIFAKMDAARKRGPNKSWRQQYTKIILMSEVKQAFTRAGLPVSNWEAETGKSLLHKVYEVVAGVVGVGPSNLKALFRATVDVEHRSIVPSVSEHSETEAALRKDEGRNKTPYT